MENAVFLSRRAKTIEADTLHRPGYRGSRHMLRKVPRRKYNARNKSGKLAESYRKCHKWQGTSWLFLAHKRKGYRDGQDKIMCCVTPTSKEEDKYTMKAPSTAWSPKKAQFGFSSHTLDDSPNKKPTLKQPFMGFEQKSVAYGFVPFVKGDEMPLETEEGLDEPAPGVKLLKLQVTSALSIPINTEILIGPKGLIGGKRRPKDRCTFIGTTSPLDYLVPETEKGVGSRHFMVRFDPERKKYQIKDLGNGNGTFVKISPKLVLKSGYTIAFGEVHFVVTISQTELVIKFLEGPKANQQLKFKTGTRQITIGRLDGSVIHFSSGSLSRKQCKIVYEKNEWVVVDGDGIKGSTNGTWLFAEDFIDLEEGMTIKAAQILFQTHLVDTI